MGERILVTGGARSGKSTFGEELLKKYDGPKAYIATAIAFDEGMKNRIEKHQNQRPDCWKTYELPYNISSEVKSISKEFDHVIIDCITVFVTNILLRENCDWDQITQEEVDPIERKIVKEINAMVDAFKAEDLNVIFITNEVGSGIVPERPLGRIYRDIAGRVNQLLGKRCEHVYATISGIPLKLK